MLNELAQELNKTLEGTTAGALLSDLGTRLYFPKGIIAQSGEAKKSASFANGTIGMCMGDDGNPVTLPSINESVPSMTTRELVAYAPTAGIPELREIWKEKMIAKNPDLKGKSISLPVVVPGLSAGISYLADLFLDETKGLLAADPSWDNYTLIADARRNASFKQFAMFKDGKFNISGLEEAMRKEAESGSVRVILNFPQNPSGYSPTSDERKQLVEIIKKMAEEGKKVMVWCDDAYFGLNYEDNIEAQSLFAYLADLHENVLAAKIDGPTKEEFAWGFRVGFITFGCKGMTDAQYNALVTKLNSAIRSSVSCSSTPSQNLLLKAFKNPTSEAKKLEYRNMLCERYKIVRKFCNENTCSTLTPLPFNSGYFMSFNMPNGKSNELRQKLLAEKGIGVISIDANTLRVAFSSIPQSKLLEVYKAIYEVAETVK